jgi:hypothetical protein
MLSLKGVRLRWRGAVEDGNSISEGYSLDTPESFHSSSANMSSLPLLYFNKPLFSPNPPSNSSVLHQLCLIPEQPWPLTMMRRSSAHPVQPLGLQLWSVSTCFPRPWPESSRLQGHQTRVHGLSHQGRPGQVLSIDTHCTMGNDRVVEEGHDRYKHGPDGEDSG